MTKQSPQVYWNVDHFLMDTSTEDRLKKLYPAFDKELIKMESWYLANPTKRKKNNYRFIVNWLNKTLDKPETTKKMPKDYSSINAHQEEKIKQWKEEGSAPPPPEWTKLKQKLARSFEVPE